MSRRLQLVVDGVEGALVGQAPRAVKAPSGSPAVKSWPRRWYVAALWHVSGICVAKIANGDTLLHRARFRAAECLHDQRVEGEITVRDELELVLIA